MNDRLEEIRRLQELRDQGALTEEEFARAKARLLSQIGSPEYAPYPPSVPVPRSPSQARDVTIWLHISVLAGLLIPIAGYIAPVVLWQVNKQIPMVDAHGRAIANWLVSSLIYAAVSGILTCIVIGFVPLIALIILNIVFPIIGAVRASRGELWPYPLSINFFK